MSDEYMPCDPQMSFSLGDVPPSPTVHAMELSAQKIRLLKDEIEKMDAKYAELNNELDAACGKFLDMLKETGKASYRSDVGTATIKYRTSVRLPDTDSDRALFFDWLKSKGIFESSIGVHSNKLKSLYESEQEAAKARGEGMEFSIPGIKHVSVTEWLSFTRK